MRLRTDRPSEADRRRVLERTIIWAENRYPGYRFSARLAVEKAEKARPDEEGS